MTTDEKADMLTTIWRSLPKLSLDDFALAARGSPLRSLLARVRFATGYAVQHTRVENNQLVSKQYLWSEVNKSYTFSEPLLPRAELISDFVTKRAETVEKIVADMETALPDQNQDIVFLEGWWLHETPIPKMPNGDFGVIIDTAYAFVPR